MPSTRETAIAGLHTVLQSIGGITALRNHSLPKRIPDGGLVILRDGDEEDQQFDTTLSPLTYHFEWKCEIEVMVDGQTAEARDTALDLLLQQIGAAIQTDKTLGGAVEHCEILPPQLGDLAVDGAEGIKGAVVPVILFFSSTSPI